MILGYTLTTFSKVTQYIYLCTTQEEIRTLALLQEKGPCTRLLAWIGKQLHTALNKLNSVWYRFLLYCFIEISKWPNQTTGELSPVTHVGVLVGQHAP